MLDVATGARAPLPSFPLISGDGVPELAQAFVYQPTARQMLFHQSPAKYRLYGGAAGGGKSTALRWEGIRQCNEIAYWEGLIFRETFPELERSQIKRFREELPWVRWNDRLHRATFPNGSTLTFGYVDSDLGVQQYKSDEYGYIGGDELTEHTLYRWQFLMSRLRTSVGRRPNFAGSSNPGGRGHSFVKALWVDGVPAPGMTAEEYGDPSLYAFIPAKCSDNPHIDPGYADGLSRLSSHLRAMYRDGNWNVVAGAYFDIFDATPEAEGGKHLTRRLPEPWHKRWMSMDWGFKHPAVTHWFAQDDRNDILVYRENKTDHTGPTSLARAVSEASRDEVIEALYLSPDAWQKRTDERVIADQLGDVWSDNEHSLGVMPTRATDARVSGWQLIYDLLQEGRLQIHESCKELIRTLPLMQRPGPGVVGDPEDCLKMEGIDDAPDSLRYGLASRLGVTRVPYEVRVQRRMDALAASRGAVNGQEAAMRARIVEAAEKKYDAPLRLRRH